ncbi:MAG: ABC transporter permease [Candidatus Limiplasma sp.]|nr:ABC transporter permease [Candidatus Limiplasma sp.]
MRKGLFARLALTGIRKNGKIYYPYMLTAVVTTAMLYIMASLKKNPELEGSTLGFSLSLGLFVTTLFAFIFLFYTNSFLMKRRKKEFGLYMVLGMERKHLARVIWWETAFLWLVSLGAGLGLGVLLDKLMHLALGKLLGKSVALGFYVSGEVLWLTAFLISLVFALTLLNAIRQVWRADPIELLHGGSVGEKEPRNKWVLTLLGVVCLGAGYWLSIMVKDSATMIFVFFFAVLLVIAGTYLLFTSGSITVLKLLKRSRRYYYQPSHFISVSGMVYRMKQNAVGLANICILLTMVLVMVFSTTSLWWSMEDILNQQLRGDISIDTLENAPDDLLDVVDQELDRDGLKRGDTVAYRFLSFTAFQNGDAYAAEAVAGNDLMLVRTPAVLYLLPLEDYNRSFGQSETLEENQILLEDYRNSHPEDTLTLFDRTFTVKKRIADQLDTGSALVSMYNTCFLVVKDMDVVRWAFQRQQETYRENASSIRTTLWLSLPGATDRQIVDAADRLMKRLDENMGLRHIRSRPALWNDELELYGGLLFVGLFLSVLFLMAMVLIMYYKQITEGYEDRERYRIMRKVGLSQAEIRRSVSSQIVWVFFLPLAAAALHIAAAFPGIVTMMRALAMTNVKLMALCALGSVTLFALLYGGVYLFTSRVYEKIVSE